LLFTLDILKDTAVFANGQTGQLAKANGRTKDAIGIVRRCEERARDAIEKSQRKVMWVF